MLTFYDGYLFDKEELKEAHLGTDEQKNKLIELYRTKTKEELLERKKNIENARIYNKH